MTEKKRKIHIVGINSYKFEDLPLKLQTLFLETVSIAVPNSYFEKIKSWGHGDKVRPKSRKEAYDRMSDLTDVVLKTKHIQGFCYTQLTDIEQETNGIYLYDRKNKFNMKLIRKIFKDKVKKAKKDYLQ